MNKKKKECNLNQRMSSKIRNSDSNNIKINNNKFIRNKINFNRMPNHSLFKIIKNIKIMTISRSKNGSRKKILNKMIKIINKKINRTNILINNKIKM